MTNEQRPAIDNVFVPMLIPHLLFICPVHRRPLNAQLKYIVTSSPLIPPILSHITDICLKGGRGHSSDLSQPPSSPPGPPRRVLPSFPSQQGPVCVLYQATKYIKLKSFLLRATVGMKVQGREEYKGQGTGCTGEYRREKMWKERIGKVCWDKKKCN